MVPSSFEGVVFYFGIAEHREELSEVAENNRIERSSTRRRSWRASKTASPLRTFTAQRAACGH